MAKPVKSKIWLYHLPTIALFTGFFWIQEAGLRGDLPWAWLRETIFPVLSTIHGQHTNIKFQLRGPQLPKNKIVIVEIDNDSIEKYGRWPWHRDLTGMLIQNIFDAGAKHVGLDMVFSEPDPRVSPALAELLEKNHLHEQIQNFETDHFLENVMIFNSENLTLGWMSAGHCQPSYAPNDCAAAEPNAPALSSVNMPKFSLPAVLRTTPFRVRETPLMVTPQFVENIPMYAAAVPAAGHITATPDRDGYIRRALLLMMDPSGNVYPSLPLAMASAIRKEKIELRLGPQSRVEELKFATSGRVLPVSALGLMDVNFRGPGSTFQYVKASEVMGNEDGIRIERDRTIASVSKKELLKDAIVLIGVSAVGVFEMRAFPFDSNVPGVEGHANILDNLLSFDMLQHGDGKNGTLAMYFFLTLGALLFALVLERLESIPSILLFVAFLGGGFYVDQKVLFEANENWNTSIFLIECALLFFGTFAVKYILEEQNKKFIRGAFGKYVSPAIIDSIMADPTKLTVGGEKRELTIVFSDIRSFTTFSEKMDAKTLATFLNDYLGKMTDIVFDTEGTLDKYIGDAVMAFWGAPLDQPRHAVNAVRAAIQMQQLLDRLRPEYRANYDIEVNVGIGINTGGVNVGNMGSERIFEYTVIGDHVNLASRLEGLTKEYHAEILTTRGTFDEIEKVGEVLPAHRILDFVKVKGKKQAVELIQVLIRSMSKDGLAIFAEARSQYSAQKWDEAIAGFTLAAELLAVSGLPDAISLDYIERCRKFILNPPAADWDGAWVMKTK